jgi:hypothetical protein
MDSDVTAHGKDPSCHPRVVFKMNEPGARHAQSGVFLGSCVAAGSVVIGFMSSCTGENHC